MSYKIRLIKSKTAEALLQRELTNNELMILNYLYDNKDDGVTETTLMATFVRSTKTTYKKILSHFETAGIIIHKTGFYHDRKNPGASFCRKYRLNKEVILDLKKESSFTFAEKKLDVSFIYEDNSIITDQETKIVLDNLSRLKCSDHSDHILSSKSYALIQKFKGGVMSVKKTKTGRICHILLHAGSKAIRGLFTIDNEKPLEVDGKSFHWQLLVNNLPCLTERKTLQALINSGFYENIMQGTGLKDRDAVKKACQKVLTCSKMGKAVAAIREYLFSLLPSLRTFCESIWLSGKTVQAFLQEKESTFVNDVIIKMNRAGKWIIPLYDAFLIKEKDESLLMDMVSLYAFERKML